MKFEFGIERERLVDCYAKKKVAEDIEVRRRPCCLATFSNRACRSFAHVQKLEKDGHILVIKTDDKEQLYPLSPRFRLEVSQRVVDAWRAVRLPHDDTDLDKVRGQPQRGSCLHAPSAQSAYSQNPVPLNRKWKDKVCRTQLPARSLKHTRCAGLRTALGPMGLF